jgi:hypothetical protein
MCGHISTLLNKALISALQMRTRHSNMLNRANYLQTVSEPRIVSCLRASKWSFINAMQFYKPWDLRPDEEDRIEEQIRDAQAQIDKELDEFDEQYRRHNNPLNARVCKFG